MDLTAVLSFTAFIGLVIWISWWKTRGTDLGHTEGYFLGGRSLTWYLIAASLILTNISTEQMIGLNGDAFTHGMSVMAWESVASIAMVVMALFFLPRYLKSGISTIPQFLEARFGKNMRSMISLMLLVSLTIGFLPFVLYSGAVGMNSLFHVDVAFGISTQASLWIMIVALSIAGIGFAICGGLKAVAIADTVYGVGLVLGGFLIPVLGLLKLGDGSISEAFHIMATNRPELLNPVTTNPHANIPFSTLFTGMLIINLFYWCTNQAIVQRTFGAKNLAESQKGVLFAAFLKIIGIGMLVLPGIIAWHLNALGKISVPTQDVAYPVLVAAVLPPWLTGFFAAVMFGAIISAFNGGLNSVTTLFSMDLYKPLIRKQASESEVVWAGRIFGIILVIICIFIAPQIQESGGFYTLMRKLLAFLKIPILAIVLMAVFSKRAPAKAAFIAVPISMAFWYWGMYVKKCVFFGHEIHWLHLAGIYLLLLMGIMIVVRWIKPTKEAYVQKYTGEVDLTFWKGAKVAGAVVVTLVVGMYWILNRFF